MYLNLSRHDMRKGDEIDQDATLLQQLTQTVLDNLENEQFGVEDLSKQAGMSRSRLHCKLKRYTGKSISQLIGEVRLEQAMKLLQKDVATISGIAYGVGFSSPSYFSNSFQKYCGYPPGETKHISFRDKQVNHQDTDEDAHNIEPGRIDELSGQPPNRVNKPEVRTLLITGQGGIILKTMAVFVLAWSVGMTVFYFLKNEEGSFPAEKSIAVLPFDNCSAKEENRYFAGGIVVYMVSGHFLFLIIVQLRPQANIDMTA